MSEIIIENLSRRRFLQGSAGLTLGFCLPAIAAGAACQAIATECGQWHHPCYVHAA